MNDDFSNQVFTAQRVGPKQSLISSALPIADIGFSAQLDTVNPTKGFDRQQNSNSKVDLRIENIDTYDQTIERNSALSFCVQTWCRGEKGGKLIPIKSAENVGILIVFSDTGLLHDSTTNTIIHNTTLYSNART